MSLIHFYCDIKVLPKAQIKVQISNGMKCNSNIVKPRRIFRHNSAYNNLTVRIRC